MPHLAQEATHIFPFLIPQALALKANPAVLRVRFDALSWIMVTFFSIVYIAFSVSNSCFLPTFFRR